ncbi:MAG: arginase family protein, partial [Pseudomonadota bacterium]
MSSADTTDFFQPISGSEMPRFSGVPTFMRLPHVAMDDPRFAEVDIGIVGVPWDGGTTNRPGPRHGPRQLRDLSTMIRVRHPVSKINPYQAAHCADVGDVAINPAGLDDSMERVTAHFRKMKAAGVRPLTAGGDHMISLPILRALAADGPLGMIHFDAHTDLFDTYFGGFKYTHGTPFRRAIEEGLLDPTRVIQIGIRGTQYDGEDIEWGRAQGVTIIEIEEFFARGVGDVMAQARQVVGDAPTYVSYDIDFV